MSEPILVPLDTTTAAEQVLPEVTALATALRRSVVLLAVVPDGAALHPVLEAHDAEVAALIERRERYAREYLDGVRSRLEALGLDVECLVAVGNVADQIGAAAADQDASMIAMATHGRVGMQRWFLGSVADRVVHTVTEPVLLVRPPEEGATPAASVERVLVPLDGSELAEEALPRAREIASACVAPITLLRAVPMDWILSSDTLGIESEVSPQLLEVIEQDAKGYLDKAAEDLRAAGFEVETVFAPYSHPAEDIARLAEQAAGTLVVMTTHGRSGLGRTILGSVADRVIRSSGAPVLLVHSGVSA
jgi:nucleotide-binding universal stress UspA family protein